MELLSQSSSYFENAKVTWRDIVWAIENQIISWRYVREFALLNLNDINSKNFDIESQIVNLGKNDAHEIMELARQTSPFLSEEDRDLSKRKWLYLILKNTYVKKDSSSDFLVEIEKIYVDFGYPESMEGFVGYLAPKDGWNPNVHTRTENMARIIRNWEFFLTQEEQFFERICNVHTS